MNSKMLSFFTGLLVTIIIIVITLFALTIFFDMRGFSSIVLLGDFFKIYEFSANEKGFEFNIKLINLIPIGIVGGLISIGLTMFLKRFITIK